MTRSLPWILLIFISLALGCKLMPGWKSLSKAETDRLERAVEEQIRTSDSFRTLDDLCVNQLPIPDDFRFLNKHASWKGEDYLVYFYRSQKRAKSDWQDLKFRFKEYFRKTDWEITDESDASWGSSELRARNKNFLVIINYQGLGEADYAFTCGNASTSPDEN